MSLERKWSYSVGGVGWVRRVKERRGFDAYDLGDFPAPAGSRISTTHPPRRAGYKPSGATPRNHPTPKPPTTRPSPSSNKPAPELATTQPKRHIFTGPGYNANPMMFPLLRLARHVPRAPLLRPFTTTAALPKNKPSKQNLPARPTPPPEDDIEEAFVKGSGPGGQKIVTSPFPPRSKPRRALSWSSPTRQPRISTQPRSYAQSTETLTTLPVKNKTNSAVQLKHLPTGIVVKSQATRSRSQNRAIARNLLAARLDELHNGDASRSAAVGDLKRRKRASAAKKSRRKYRAHEAEREEGEAGEEGEVDVGVEVERGEEIRVEVGREGETTGEATGEAEGGRRGHGEGKTGDSRE